MSLGIRKYKKDHLKELAPPLSAIPSNFGQHEVDDPLRFWTSHENSFLVDLNVFASGDHNSSNPSGNFLGGFSGRPELIVELAPVIKVKLEFQAPRTCKQLVQALRYWWRLFDQVEEDFHLSGTYFERVKNVSQITEIHQQRAYDQKMDRGSFGVFLATINIVRQSKGLKQYHWLRPELRSAARHLPPEWQFRKMRTVLKHDWFKVLFRWERADELLAGLAPISTDEEHLLRNYKLFQEIVTKTGNPRPPASALRGERSIRNFYRQGYNVVEMLQGIYPDANDIRIAFHFCLATTGWNPAVFLSLDANVPFIEPHPKDPTRYFLRGYKARAHSEQMYEGMYKSKGSAGVILLTLMRRTEPLRAQLRKELSLASETYEQMVVEGRSQEELNKQRKKIVKLREGVASVWLYVTPTSDKIFWLDRHGNAYSRNTNQTTKNSNFLNELIGRINSGQTEDRQLSCITAGDFRDAFASYVYSQSGGVLLFVMKSLGHKTPRSTQIYLDKTHLNEQSKQLYRTFSNSLWTEIKVYGRLDPTIISHCSRYGEATPAQRNRLDEYRDLSRSRIGVGCKDPTNPPKKVAPHFNADGKAKCYVHRCMLCLEHAVIFPESLPGLCKRLAELRYIQSRMSVVAFLESSFKEEMTNTEVALRGFGPKEQNHHLEEWERKIKDGRHIVMDHDGLFEIR